jgi:two-component system phosphate regulon response regulator PhoB
MRRPAGARRLFPQLISFPFIRNFPVSKELILVVEDEEDIQELVRYNLSREGFQVQCAGSAEEALRAAKGNAPDLILLDLMLPGMDGLDFCRLLKGREEFQKIPIVIMSAKGEEADVVAGLDLGADDYMTKPFSSKVLVARIRTLLRRRESGKIAHGAEPLQAGTLVIDAARHAVMLNDGSVALTATEFRVLHFLASRRGRVLTRGQIVDAVRGEDYPVTERSVDVHIVSLRKKLGAEGKNIETVRGVGYRFRD